MDGWHKGLPVVWYGRNAGGGQFHWYCVACQAMGVDDHLSLVWRAGESHRKTARHD